jgi:hypothetical protein
MMNQKTLIVAVIVALVGLGMVTSAYAKQFGNGKVHYTTDVDPISSTSDGGGDEGGDEGGSGDDDERGVPVIIVIDIDSVDDDSI